MYLASWYKNAPVGGTWYNILDITAAGFLLDVATWFTIDAASAHWLIYIDGDSPNELDFQDAGFALGGYSLSQPASIVRVHFGIRFNTSLKILVKTDAGGGKGRAGIAYTIDH